MNGIDSLPSPTESSADLKGRETGGLIDPPQAPEIPPRRPPASQHAARLPGTSVPSPA